MIHVWPLIAIPEARRARDRIVAFLGERDSRAQRSGRASARSVGAQRLADRHRPRSDRTAISIQFDALPKL